MRKTLATYEGINVVGFLAILVTLLVAFPVIGTAQKGSNAPVSIDRQAIERLFAAWNSRDTEKLVGAFGNEAVYEDVAAGMVHRGKDKIREWVDGAFRDIENFKLEILSRKFFKDGGLVEWVWSGTDKGLFKTGKSFSVRGVSVIQVRAGRVSSYKEYYDFATVMRQLGLLPTENEEKQ